MKFSARFWGISLSFIFFIPSFALSVGNFNVRRDNYDWMLIQSEHFDVYYDQSTEKLVPSVVQHLEDAWKEVGDRLNYQVKERTPFFFYTNHNEFEQTNIVPIGEGTGGVTEAFKNRFLIFNDGSQTWMRHVIFHEFGHVVQFNVLYGGFWKSIRLLKSPFYPLWLMEGMAEYGSGDIDDPMSIMVVRDAVATNTLIELPELQGFAHLKPNQVTLGYKTGDQAMTFLADEFGTDKVGKLLVTMESHFDVSAALEQLLGLNLNRFNFRFKEWLGDRYSAYLKDAKSPEDYGPRLTKKDRLPQFNEAPALSPDGKYIYYFSDQDGPTEIWRYDLESEKNSRLVKLNWSRIENMHVRASGLSVSHDGRTLAFAGEKKQRDFLYLYDLKEKKLQKVKAPFTEIRSPVFSPVDNTILCIGMTNGQNDLYLISMEGDLIKQVTSTPQDESSPTFSHDGNQIVFSGEVLEEGSLIPAGRDLFQLSLSTGGVQRLTSEAGDEESPEVLPNGKILLTRDVNANGGLGSHLVVFDPEMKTFDELTKLVGGAFSPQYDSVNDNLYYVGFHAGERHLYRYDQFHLNEVARKPKQIEKINPEEDLAALVDEAEHKPSIFKPTSPMQDWDSGLASPLVLGQAKPYQFRASTDLFLPFFYYSSVDGVVLADIWQFSDYLGNHQIQQQLQYASGNEYLDTALFYTYAGLRPNFTFGYRQQQFYRDFDEEHRQRDRDVIAFVSYPLDRVQALQAGVGLADEKQTFIDNSEPDVLLRERYWLAGWTHDTITGRYLIATRGHRLNLFYQYGINDFGADQSYRTGGGQAVKYFPLPAESVLASRIFYARSTGENPQEFRLGGVDRVRAVTRGGDESRRQNVAFASAEMRLRMAYLNARTKFLFPDFFFKAAYLILFDDVGYGWDTTAERKAFTTRKLNNTIGVGISWPTYILQSFQLNLTVQWASRTDTDSDLWYITVGPTF